jgi:hypothetical protein
VSDGWRLETALTKERGTSQALIRVRDSVRSGALKDYRQT